MVWAFVLSIYQLYFQPMYNDWLTSTGHTIGLAETAGGFFSAWTVATFLGWWIARAVGGAKKT